MISFASLIALPLKIKIKLSSNTCIVVAIVTHVVAIVTRVVAIIICVVAIVTRVVPTVTRVLCSCYSNTCSCYSNTCSNILDVLKLLRLAHNIKCGRRIVGRPLKRRFNSSLCRSQARDHSASISSHHIILGVSSYLVWIYLILDVRFIWFSSKTHG